MSYDGIEYLASTVPWTKMVHAVNSNYTHVTEAIACNIDYNVKKLNCVYNTCMIYPAY